MADGKTTIGTDTRPLVAAAADDDDDTRCVICLDAVSEPCIAQPCAHGHFDFLCLVSWLLQRRPSCPLCKATVVTVQYSFADGSCKTFDVPQNKADSQEVAPDAPPRLTPSTPVSAAIPRRRRRDHGRPSPTSSSISSSLLAAALDRRRRVYRLGLYALHVGANRHSRYYRELTPRMFAQDPDLVSRARAFLRRELTVLLPEHDGDGDCGGTDYDRSRHRSHHRSSASRRLSTRAFLLEYVVAILQTMDTQGSAGQAEELLRDFLGRNRARLFLHELRSWLRSPYLTLESWDRHVQYGAPEKSFFHDDGGHGHDHDDYNDDRHQPRRRFKTRRGDCWQPASPMRRGNAAALQEDGRPHDPS